MYNKSSVECYNCHKHGHYANECISRGDNHAANYAQDFRFNLHSSLFWSQIYLVTDLIVLLTNFSSQKIIMNFNNL